MRSNTFSDNLKGQLIWAYFILIIVAPIMLVMLMQDVYLIHTKLDPKQAMYLYVRETVISWISTKQSIIITSSNHAEIIAIMKKVENVCG